MKPKHLLFLPMVFLLFLSVPVFATVTYKMATDDIMLSDGVNQTLLVKFNVPCGVYDGEDSQFQFIVNSFSEDNPMLSMMSSLNNSWTETDSLSDLNSVWSGFGVADDAQKNSYNNYMLTSVQQTVIDAIETCNGKVTLGFKIKGDYPSEFTGKGGSDDANANVTDGEKYAAISSTEDGYNIPQFHVHYTPYYLSLSDYIASVKTTYDGSVSTFNVTWDTNDAIDSAWIIGIDASNHTMTNEGSSYLYSTVLPEGNYSIFVCANTTYAGMLCTDSVSYSVVLPPPPPPFYIVVIPIIIGIGLALYIFKTVRDGELDTKKLLGIALTVIIGLAFMAVLMGLAW